ncbi:MAG: integrase arm-type DNA-binding domain-containing protein [Alphaproteobacteria bacterium]|nr:integrase arm-type DNA-binding domain-containing protein [Alphaproteobacteria bacterium]
MLTDLQCRNAKPREKGYALADGRGLYLNISPTGGKHWKSRYRFVGKLNWHSIGPYPEVSMAKARTEHQKIRDMVRNNINPAIHRQETKKRLLAEHEATFEVVAAMWFEHKKTRIVPKHAQAVWRGLEANLFPCFGKKPIRQIGIPDVLDALKKIEARGAHDLVRRIKQQCREVFAFAIIHQLTTHNPAAMFEAKDVFARYSKTHFASIEPDELPTFLGTIRHNKHRLQPITHIAIELMLLTFVRTSELIMARWEEIDFEKAEWLTRSPQLSLPYSSCDDASRARIS